MDFEFDNLQTDKAYALNASYYEWGMYRKGSYGRTAKAATMDVYKYVTLKGGEEPSSPIIQFADAEVKRICVENWDTNADGELSEEEAAAVTDLAGVFTRNANITSFDELKYFTGLTTIPSYSFNKCSLLKKISIPQGVESIGYGAMAQCDKLEVVELPTSLNMLGDCVFYDCSGLQEIQIPNGVTTIGEGSFKGCMSLASVSLPSNLTEIGPYAFQDCIIIESLTLPSALESIGEYAFYGCSKLNSMFIPQNVKEIGNRLFSKCENMTSLTVSSANPYYYSMNNCILADQNIDNDVVAVIGYGCTGSTIPTVSKVKRIGMCSFAFVTGIKELVIPDNIEAIGQEAFCYCEDLEIIRIGKNVNIIQDWAFCDNKKIREVYVQNPVPVAISDNVFHTETIWNDDGSFNTTKDFTTATLYVPYGCKAAYQAADGWKNFHNIVEMEPENKQGDLNGDGLINGTDLVALVSVIMGQEEQSQAADVNADGLVNGTDYVALVDLILNEGNAPVKALVRDNVHHQSEVALGIEPFGMESAKEGMMTITLDNPEMDVTMVQFDLTLPRGLRLQSQNDDYSVLMTGRTTWKDHAIFVGKQDDGSVRLMLASAQNATVKDTEGGILRISLVADDDFDGGEVVINNILCTSPSLLECRPQACRIHLTKEDVTAIREASADASEGNLYNLAGQSVSKPQKGLYISNGRKRIVR